jgi:N-acetylmuramic acid 6-phosphate etherase
MEPLQQRGHLLTEHVNPASQNLDQLSSLAMVDLFNREDAKAIAAVAHARKDIAHAIDVTTIALKQGGRLFYIGAGTSGRLGVLDAAECPPPSVVPLNWCKELLQEVRQLWSKVLKGWKTAKLMVPSPLISGLSPI